jgi:hypothetical protein
MARKTSAALLPGWVVILLDMAALALAFYVFALFHHILPRSGGEAMLEIVEVASLPTEVMETPAPESTPPPLPPGDFSATFPAHDTGEDADWSYQSDNLRVAIRKGYQYQTTYFVADVWVRGIDHFRTAFAKGQYGQGYTQNMITMAEANHAILALSGDYDGARNKGLVVRNGKLYRDSMFEDVCVLYQDGVMETYTAAAVNLDGIVARKAYQAWSFGPALLGPDGQALAEIPSASGRKNPRAAIGYYEPGHYCFVAVDGRQSGYAEGITLVELSRLFADLGCKAAYNLDGGQTAMMGFEGALVNKPYNGGRPSSDILYVWDGGAGQ